MATVGHGLYSDATELAGLARIIWKNEGTWGPIGEQNTDNYEYDRELSASVGIRMFSPPKRWNPPRLFFEVSGEFLLHTVRNSPRFGRYHQFVEELRRQCTANGLALHRESDLSKNIIRYEVKKK